MELYLDIPFVLAVLAVLVASLIAASGVAAVTRGWVLPVNRPRVHRVRLYGWGQLGVAFGLCCQVLFGLMISNPGIRSLVTLTGSGLLLSGIIVMMVSQRPGANRQGSGTP
ncbi:hypothetical protein JL475_03755 [Streptomyces sp. M2CJ-2]|uniref:hypothetical protein n=1 Tax=Streptomyces sp. M2CJ-2 TaxID=2803948 RepID=UPI001922E2A0|nr:hypothetical protein [Streptomyces sp. M2CJ-2]MBL3665146.1 hypothetical protein [Streptomyces sp. M2CJ-2]